MYFDLLLEDEFYAQINEKFSDDYIHTEDWDIDKGIKEKDGVFISYNGQCGFYEIVQRFDYHIIAAMIAIFDDEFEEGTARFIAVLSKIIAQSKSYGLLILKEKIPLSPETYREIKFSQIPK